MNVTYKNVTNGPIKPEEGFFIVQKGKEILSFSCSSIQCTGFGFSYEDINPMLSQTTNLVVKVPENLVEEMYYVPNGNELRAIKMGTKMFMAD